MHTLRCALRCMSFIYCEEFYRNSDSRQRRGVPRVSRRCRRFSLYLSIVSLGKTKSKNGEVSRSLAGMLFAPGSNAEIKASKVQARPAAGRQHTTYPTMQRSQLQPR